MGHEIRRKRARVCREYRVSVSPNLFMGDMDKGRILRSYLMAKCDEG